MEKTCTNCRWCDWPAFATGDLTVIEITAACFHDAAKAWPSMVTGSREGRPCAVMRNGNAPCGPEGRLWEGKGKAVTP